MADRIFPLEYRIRNGVAYAFTAASRADVTPDQAIVEVKRALASNPYAADLRANMIKLYAEKNDLKDASAEFAILKKIVPNSYVVKALEKAGMK